MSLIWTIRHALTGNLIKNSRKLLLKHHCREVDGYLHIVRESKDNGDYESYSFFNQIIGDYLTNHLLAIIRESEPMMVRRELETLKQKRDELIKEYNNWFFKEETIY